ncbi:unnamed protein product, partial [Effrenium voratum]
EMPPMVTCKMGDYQHSFVFHLLDEVVAQSWLPRAQVNHRWEIEEPATECHFGYKWVALSDWGPCLGEGALLCSWLKGLFHNRRGEFMSQVAKLVPTLGDKIEVSLKRFNRTESSEFRDFRAPQPVPRPAVPSKPPEELRAWLAHVFHGFAHLPDDDSSKREELVASLCCRWAVECEEVTSLPEKCLAPSQAAPHAEGGASGGSFLCFHGTSQVACRQIAQDGFDASRRSASLGKIVPYLVGEYLSSDPKVALKYSRQKEIGKDTLSMLVVQVPESNFEMRNGVWFQRKLAEPAEEPKDGAIPRPDFGQSSTLVCADERVLVPRAILTFRPSRSVLKSSSAMVNYDVGVTEASFRKELRLSEEALPAAVLFDLDMTCWPFTLGTESRGPPFITLPEVGAAADSVGRRLRLCKVGLPLSGAQVGPTSAPVSFEDIPEIFRTLKEAEIPIVLCSRSNVPNWCREFMAACRSQAKTSEEGEEAESGASGASGASGSSSSGKVGDMLHAASVIRPGIKKLGHLKEIRAALDVPFHRLLFFDDDQRNCDDGKLLGVRCVKVPRNGAGVTMDIFTEGLRTFSQAAKVPNKNLGQTLPDLKDWRMGHLPSLVNPSTGGG